MFLLIALLEKFPLFDAHLNRYAVIARFVKLDLSQDVKLESSNEETLKILQTRKVRLLYCTS